MIKQLKDWIDSHKDKVSFSPNDFDMLIKEPEKPQPLVACYLTDIKELPDFVTNLPICELTAVLKYLDEPPANLERIKRLESLIIKNENNALKLTSASSIFRLTNLKILDLRNNKISILPKEIGRLINLEKLLLDNNKLQELPTEVRSLTALKTLSLAHNYINRIEAIYTISGLENLCLSDNLSFSVNANCLARLSNIKQLYLCGSCICERTITEIAAITSLEKFYVTSSYDYPDIRGWAKNSFELDSDKGGPIKCMKYEKLT